MKSATIGLASAALLVPLATNGARQRINVENQFTSPWMYDTRSRLARHTLRCCSVRSDDAHRTYLPVRDSGEVCPWSDSRRRAPVYSLVTGVVGILPAAAMAAASKCGASCRCHDAANRWRGKIAVVTGASAGIGRDIAVQLCTKAGMRVVGCARRMPALRQVEADIARALADGGACAGSTPCTRCGCKPGATPAPEFVGVSCDLTRDADIGALFASVDAKWPGAGVDVLVNNAGIAHEDTVLEGSWPPAFTPPSQFPSCHRSRTPGVCAPVPPRPCREHPSVAEHVRGQRARTDDVHARSCEAHDGRPRGPGRQHQQHERSPADVAVHTRVLCHQVRRQGDHGGHAT